MSYLWDCYNDEDEIPGEDPAQNNSCKENGERGEQNYCEINPEPSP